MKAVKVQYTVVPQYADRNKANIREVMKALKKNPIDGMLYSSYSLEEDPNTFVHINIAKDEETMSKLNEFKIFRKELKASDPVRPPKSTNLNLVSASIEV